MTAYRLKYQDSARCLRRVTQPPHIAGPLATIAFDLETYLRRINSVEFCLIYQSIKMKTSRFFSLFIALPMLQLGIVNGQESLVNQTNKNSNTLSAIKYINITNISYGIGIGGGTHGSSGHSSFGVHTISGCIISSKLSIGIGVGLDRLRISENLGQTILPVSLDARYFLLNGPRILFYGVEGGYSFNLNGNELGPKSGGLFIDPAFGIKVVSFKKISLSMNIGIEIQENTIQYVWMPLPKNETLLNFKVGIIF